MTTGASVRPLLAPIERCINWWYDRAASGRATAVFLALFVLAWTAYHIAAQASVDVHFDLLEIYGWGRHPSAGYYKHPPFTGWVAAAWFAIFPAADWSFHLLAMINAAAALFAVDLIARRYLDGDKRLLVLMLLLLTPFYQFHGQRISTNQLLLSTWPIATYCFLRAFESRGLLWSVAAGMAAALAMLSKYYSVYLVAALVAAALTHPARWTYLKSPSPWISAATGLILLTPHLLWLRTVKFGPFDYAYLVHGTSSITQLLTKTGTYILGAIGYVVLPCIAYAFAVRPDSRTLADAFWPADPDRRMLVILLGTMILLPPLTAPFIGMQLTSLWTMSAWFLLPIVLLAPDTAVLPRRRAVQVGMVVVALTIGALLAAPAIAWRTHIEGTKEDARAHYRLISEQLAEQWRQATAQPLRIVLGSIDLAAGGTFYHPDHPDSAPDFDLRAAPWITPDRLKREGWAAACPSSDAACIRTANQLAARDTGVRHAEIEVVRHFFGAAGKPGRYTLVIVPPQPAGAQAPADVSAN